MKFGKTIQRTEPQAENKEKETKNKKPISPKTVFATVRESALRKKESSLRKGSVKEVC